MKEDKFETDIEIELADSEIYSIYNEYCSALSGIFFYQDQQITLRVNCIKILLGLFAIFGLLFYKGHDLNSNLPSIIMSLFSFAGFWVVNNIFQSDLLYREGLKMGFFIEALSLEQENSWIPNFHGCLISKENIHQSPGAKQARFYGSAMIANLTLLGIALSTFSFFSSLRFRIVIGVIICTIFLLWVYKARVDLRSENISLRTSRLKHSSIPKPLTSQYKLFLSLLHGKGREYIEHYSTMKMKYKNLLIYVVSALLVGMSYMSDIHSDEIHINQLYLFVLLVGFAVVAIDLIRYLDLNISHRQIKLLSALMISHEKQFSFLSKPYTKIRSFLYKNKADPAIYDFMYYSIFNIGLICAGVILLIVHVRDHHTLKDLSICSILLVLILTWEFMGIKKVFSRMR